MSGSVSPLAWTGNKGCIYKTIDAFMPPHRTYVEPCMGSAEVFLRKAPVPKEIINDYNGDLVKFFRVLQRSEKLAYLLGRLYLSFNSEELFRANKALLADVPNILDDLTETAVIIENADWQDIELAVAFFENQTFSFSSTGKTFAIAKKDMTKKFGRIVAACSRLRNAIIMHRDYKDCINYAAGKDTFILLDPPYKGTENYYQKANFDEDEHAQLFAYMNEIHKKFSGECKFLITYNNDPYILELAAKYGFYTYVQERLHNMAQSSKPGEMFEELLIGNYDLEKQARENEKYLKELNRQLNLFDYKYNY
ncbi:MAG: DNA adenine methylase [Oscillospiraceae bacterium]